MDVHDVEVGAAAGREHIVEELLDEVAAVIDEVVVGDAAEEDLGLGVGLFDRRICNRKHLGIIGAEFATAPVPDLRYKNEAGVGFVVQLPVGDDGRAGGDR